MTDLVALQQWRHCNLVITLSHVQRLHVIHKWSGAAPYTERALWQAIPESARALPYHVLCHDVAYATFASERTQRGDEALYTFMHDQSALESQYTLVYMLAMRGLCLFIAWLHGVQVHTIGDLYDVYVHGSYPWLMHYLDVFEGTDTHDRFVSLAETLLRLFSCYTSGDVELA